MKLKAKIKEHYVKRFGEPDREALFVPPDGPEIQVLKWGAAKSQEDVCIYATLGASAALANDANHRCEFFVGLNPPVDDVAGALAEVALNGGGKDAVPSHGDSVTLAYPLWRTTEASTFLFSFGEEIIPTLRVNDIHICFLKVIPIFLNELAFKKKYGLARFWEEFQKRGVPFWDSGRKSALELPR